MREKQEFVQMQWEIVETGNLDGHLVWEEFVNDDDIQLGIAA